YTIQNAVNRIIPIINKEKPDIIHSTLFQSDIVSRKLKSKFPDIPLVGSLVSNSYSHLRFSQLNWISKLKLYSTQFRDRLSIKKVNHFISNSETIKMANAEALGIPLKKITTIFRGREIHRHPDPSNYLFTHNTLPNF